MILLKGRADSNIIISIADRVAVRDYIHTNYLIS